MANALISKKLQEARKTKGLAQHDVYRRFGVSQSTFSAWENGVSEPDIGRFLEMCRIYGIRDIHEYFMGYSMGAQSLTSKEADFVAMLRELPEHSRAAVENCLEFEHSRMQQLRRTESRRTRRISVFMQPAAAGLGNYLSDADAEEMLLTAPEEADIGIRISGDSMEPTIKDGEIVFVKYRPAIEEGEIGIFYLNGEAYCKKLSFKNGRPCLISLNPAYKPIAVRPEDTLITYGKVLL